MLPKVTDIWIGLLGCTIVLMLILFNTVNKDDTSRFYQPAYGLVYTDRDSVKSFGRNLKAGNGFVSVNTSITEPSYENEIDEPRSSPKSWIDVKKEVEDKIIAQAQHAIENVEIKKTREGIIKWKSKRRESKKGKFTFADLKQGSNSEPVKYGVSNTIARLNYEFSQKRDRFKIDSPTFKVPPFVPGNLNHVDFAGSSEIGQSIPVSSTRHILIATTWRSGSTFLGDLLNHYPGTFYYFEPLHYYAHAQESNQNLPLDETEFLESLYKCNFDKKNSGFLNHVAKDANRFLLKNHNFRLWNSCKDILPNELMCLHPTYLNAVCPLFPIKLIKTVRLRVAKVETLLKDKSLNLKVILLVRDPRGVYNSRSSGAVSQWCKKDVCADPYTGCSDLSDDLQSALTLESQFPGSIKLVRYEDLSLNPEETTQEMLKFLDLEWSPAMDNYISTHTSRDKTKYVKNKKTNKVMKTNNIYGTTKNSTATAFAWVEKMPYSKIKYIEDACAEPMEELGYKTVKNNKEVDVEDLLLEKSLMKFGQQI